MIDLLVHESSHGLLFGISAEGALTENSGTERYELAAPQRPSGRSTASFTPVSSRHVFTWR